MPKKNKKSRKKVQKVPQTQSAKHEEQRKRLFDIAQKFTKEVLDRYGKHIKSIVLFGSAVRGDFKAKSDVDLVVIVDDTTMRFDDELKARFDDKLFIIADTLSKEHKVEVSCQPGWLLTEFVEMVRNASPLVMTFLRDGVAVYDVGIFTPYKRLLEMGMFPATREAVERRMELVPKRIQRARQAKLYMVAEDVYYAMLDSAQAVLMYMGHFPPTAKEAPIDLRTVLVQQGLLDEKFPKMLEDVVAFRKRVEHQDIKDIQGEEVDAWLKKGEEFVQEMEKILVRLEQERKLQTIAKTHEVMIKATAAALKSIGKLPEKTEQLPVQFKKYFVEAGKVHEAYMDIWGRLERMHKMIQQRELHKIAEKEVYDTREDVRRFLREVKRVLEQMESVEKKQPEHREYKELDSLHEETKEKGLTPKKQEEKKK